MRRRPGFTLIEALIAAAVLSTAALGIFRLFRSINRQTSQKAWYSAALKQHRTGLKRVHDELSKASYYRLITPSDIKFIDPDDGTAQDLDDAEEETYRQNFFVEVNGTPASPNVVTPNAGEQDLMFWYQCEPRREGFPAAELTAGSSAICRLYLSGDTLVFQRERRHDPDNRVTEVFKELIHDVESVRTWVEPKQEVDDPLLGSQVTLEVISHHPNTEVFPDTKMRQEITARAPVGSKDLS